MNFCLVFGFLTIAQANTIRDGKAAKDADYYTVSLSFQCIQMLQKILQSNYEDLANLLNDYADSLYELWLPESESLNKRSGFTAPWERMLLRK